MIKKCSRCYNCQFYNTTSCQRGHSSVTFKTQWGWWCQISRITHYEDIRFNIISTTIGVSNFQIKIVTQHVNGPKVHKIEIDLNDLHSVGRCRDVAFVSLCSSRQDLPCTRPSESIVHHYTGTHWLKSPSSRTMLTSLTDTQPAKAHY